MKEILDHNTHELTEDELSAVTGGVKAVLLDGASTIPAGTPPSPQPPTKQPTTYGEAFSMLQAAAGGTPR